MPPRAAKSKPGGRPAPPAPGATGAPLGPGSLAAKAAAPAAKEHWDFVVSFHPGVVGLELADTALGVKVNGFTRANNLVYPAELCRLIRCGDVVIAVNGVPVVQFQRAADLIQAAFGVNRMAHVTFRRWVAKGHAAAELAEAQRLADAQRATGVEPPPGVPPAAALPPRAAPPTPPRGPDSHAAKAAAALLVALTPAALPTTPSAATAIRASVRAIARARWAGRSLLAAADAQAAVPRFDRWQAMSARRAFQLPGERPLAPVGSLVPRDAPLGAAGGAGRSRGGSRGGRGGRGRGRGRGGRGGRGAAGRGRGRAKRRKKSAAAGSAAAAAPEEEDGGDDDDDDSRKRRAAASTTTSSGRRQRRRYTMYAESSSSSEPEPDEADEYGDEDEADEDDEEEWTGQRAFLKPKQRKSELRAVKFAELVWPTLVRDGWRSEPGPQPFVTYYLPPGVKRGRGIRPKVHFCSSVPQVMHRIARAAKYAALVQQFCDATAWHGMESPLPLAKQLQEAEAAAAQPEPEPEPPREPRVGDEFQAEVPSRAAPRPAESGELVWRPAPAGQAPDAAATHAALVPSRKRASFLELCMRGAEPNAAAAQAQPEFAPASDAELDAMCDALSRHGRLFHLVARDLGDGWDTRRAVAAYYAQLKGTPRYREWKDGGGGGGGAGAEPVVNDEVCAGCKGVGTLILCDQCPRAFHLHCAQPPLTEVPTGEWSCPVCLGL